MSVSGPQAMRALDDALRDIRREEDEITKRIARANERVGKLHETEIGQLQALAAIRLSPEVRAELTVPLNRAETEAREMLKRHANALAELEKSLTDKEEALARLNTERQTRLSEMTKAQREIDALKDAIAGRLASDSDYQNLLSTHGEAEKTTREAERKAEQAETDREEKGRPYRDDPLFTYLWTQGYGTTDYRAGGLTRVLDGWVARLIGFNEARPNYAMLNAIPDRLREHVERLADDLEELAQRIEGRQITALDAAGGQKSRETLEAATTRLGAIDQEIIGLEDERETLAREQKTIAEGGDPAFTQAVTLLAEAISGTAIEKLLAEARTTRTEEDDAIVTRIGENRRRVTEEKAELDQDRARLKTLEARRRELEDIEYEFKTERYDDPRSRFGNEKLVGDLLNDFLKGGMTAAAYWGMWRNSQDWSGSSGPIVPQSRPRTSKRNTGFTVPPGGFSPRPPAGGNWGGFSRPRSGGGARSGGFGGSGFKTGGGFGGGKGFKTGGKF